MTNSICCPCIAVLATFFVSACAGDRHSNVLAAADAALDSDAFDIIPADAASQRDAPYIIPDTIAFPQPTGPFTIVRGQRRTLVDPSRDLEGNVLGADAGDHFGGNADAGSTRPLSVEIWYPSDTPGSGATLPYMDSAEAAATFQAAQHAALPPTQLLLYSPDFANHVLTHSYAGLPFASSLTLAPVLLFSPGYNLQPRAYTAFIEEAVSWGYIVVAISHTLYTPVTTFADGTTISMTHGMNDSDPPIPFTAGVWLADARFVLDELVKTASSDPYGEIEGHVDLTEVGMFGQSFGGWTSLGMAATDDRVMAAMDFDGSSYGNWSAQSLSKPVFIFQEPGLNSTLNNVFNQSAGIAFQAVLANSLHINFSDIGIIAAAIQLDPSLWQTNLLGTIDPVRGVQEVNGYVHAFFDSTLKGVPSPLLEGPTAQFPDVVNFSKKP